MVAHPSSRSCQTPRAIRPCRSSRLRRFAPCDPLQVYCTLQPVLRFAPFPSSRSSPPRVSARCARPFRPFPVAPCSCTPFRAFPLSSAVPRHRGPFPLIVLTDLRAFLVRQVRCRVLVLPPGRTRCSPGLRSPSGFSPLAQPAGGMPDQDPLVPGRDHHWCVRAWRTWLEFSVTWAKTTFCLRTRKQIALKPHPSDIFAPTYTVAVTFPGLFSCTRLRANTQEDTQAGPPKTLLLRLVALFLYFGLPNTAGLRCRDRPSMPGHQAWPKSTDPPQFPARDPWLSYIYRRAERKKSPKHRSAPSCSLATFVSVQNLRTSPVSRRMWRILIEQDCRPSWGFLRQRSTWG
jgi:hypothetical protein